MRRIFTISIILVMTVSASWWENLSHCQNIRETQQKPKLDVPYEPTSHGIAKAMLSMANVTSKDLVYDLGCGDGRIVIMAAKDRKARGVGVDIDPVRIKESLENAKVAGVSDLVQFIEQDLFVTDISRATVMMLYLWPEINLRLRPKLLRELKPGTRIVSHSHTMGTWKADAARTVEKHNLYLFIVPANVTGTWQWIGLERGLARLHFTQKFQEVQGTLLGNGNEPFMNCSLQGDAISCSVRKMAKGEKETLFFEGRVLGDVIEGKITDRRGGPSNTARSSRDTSTMVPIAE
jgi:SAM-dependent methyltransferase